MPQRICGPCTACCQGWLREKKLDMRPGHPCQHHVKQGCAIYADRPEDPCRRFECGWLQDAETYPDELRPDLSGVIILVDRKWQDWKVIMAIPAGPEVPPKTLEWLRVHAEKTRLPVVFQERVVKDGKFTGVRLRAFGTRDFAMAVKYAIGPEDIARM